ncbi:FtsB family cell division protein [Muricomes intestini]|jgi:cell division protein FtsB|uniref:Cell division protein FtsB n=1 Tax=Muricomes intestini TaxID=1796634 RepID=A0A4R3K5K3_9FIRM|nr:septum formation initiator family protein [Muricomes intestini]TCS78114.1 cell division protein FtsB [Muricomes intestini]HAX53578.1 cell-division initiation protein [Lachnospiraceae bacterium]HCR85013.1 cell-division initiation protein [Lachnospiraceae bacterium]
MVNKRKGVTQRSKNRRRSSGFGSHKRSVTVITVILVLLVCVLSVNALTLQAKNKDYKQQEEELRTQIKEQKERTKEIEEYKEYVKTDEYVKEMAEEKLGLVDPGEIIFKPAK